MKENNINLVELSRFLSNRLQKALPGSLAHEVMRARPRGNFPLRFKHEGPPRRGSVLILLYEKDGAVQFPLIKRMEYDGIHSGQISLPGGKMEPGEEAVETALREGEEEIGIHRKEVRVIGQLTEFHVLPSNFLVTPFVGLMESMPLFVPDMVEVARVLPAPLQLLLQEDAVKEKEILASGKFPLVAPYFEVEGEVVWGATAMILNEFRFLLKDSHS